jgi:uncharacterized phage protein gp47/JayE
MKGVVWRVRRREAQRFDDRETSEREEADGVARHFGYVFFTSMRILHKDFVVIVIHT